MNNTLVDLLSGDKTKPYELREITTKIRLAMVVGLLNATLGFFTSATANKASGGSLYVFIPFLISSLMFNIWATSAITNAKNWARVFYSFSYVVCALGVLSPITQTIFTESPVYAILNCSANIFFLHIAYELLFNKKITVFFKQKNKPDTTPVQINSNLNHGESAEDKKKVA